jgi:hypothetical protein
MPAGTGILSEDENQMTAARGRATSEAPEESLTYAIRCQQAARSLLTVADRTTRVVLILAETHKREKIDSVATGKQGRP